MKNETTVKFSKLRINNFKGILYLEINFSDDTIISGANATGKSTVFDALTWVLFGKNSLNDTKFNIKNTADTSLNRAEHVVELVMFVDNVEVTAKAVYKEKWTKKRGSEEAEFTGNETLYFWNNVPLNAGDYSKKVSEIIEETVFKQVTNPLFFNVTMTKNERRDMLVRMAGDDVTDEKVINGSEAFRVLFAKLQGQKSLIEYAKEISFEKSGIKKQLADIPARIDELVRSNPKNENWTEIETEITAKQTAITAINKEIEDINKSFDTQLIEIKAQQAKVTESIRHMSDIKIELSKKCYSDASTANKDLNEAKYQLGVVRSELRAKQLQKADNEVSKSRLENQIAKLRENWGIENAKELVFDESKFECPTCKRAYETNDIHAQKAELETNFFNSKQKTLSEITANGKAKAQELKEVEISLIALNAKILDLQAKEQSLIWSETTIPAMPKDINILLQTNSQYQALKIESEKIIEFKQPDISDQKEAKLQLQEGIDELKTTLRNKEQIAKNAVRIDELKTDEKRYSQRLADLEKQEFTIAEFQEKKMNLIESSVNGRFQYVKFKLFKLQVNGGKEPDCETMVNGVPFSDLNHAAQLNAGIDCANAISKYYGVSAPVIIDNAESVNSFLPVSGQMIRLYVTEDKCLVINN